MKKRWIVLALAALCGSFMLQAAPVSSTRALDIAKRIFSATPATKAGTGEIRIIWDGEFGDVATKTAVQPAFYVITRDGGGFVIIAGDDNVTPVLGISDHNTFKVEGMPDNVKWWMERMKAYVRSAKTQSREVREQWASYVGTKSAKISGEVTALVSRFTPEWNQNAPYNSACPLDASNNRTITGCVPLAIAEIMAYESANGVEMPSSGIGTVGGYSSTWPSGYSEEYVCPAPYDLSTHSYDWSAIANFNAADATPDQIENLAQLIADIGAAVEAMYAMGETSANSYAVPSHMIDHFYFNKAATVELASSYTRRNWIAKLKAEIDSRPLFYFGQSLVGGHAFVFDGYGLYDGDDVFHVNFGWGPFFNGYFYPFHLDTSEETDGSEEWSYDAGAIFGFYPDPDSEYPIVLEAYYYNESYPGVRAEYVAGNGYRLSYMIVNRGNTSYTGQVKFAVVKKDGSKQDISNSVIDYSVNSYGFSGSSIWYFAINNISFGDKVVCYYKVGNDWIQLGGPVGSAIAEWPLMPAAFIAIEDVYHVGDYFTFALKNNNFRYAGSLWTITDPDGEVEESILQSEREFHLTKAGTYKIKVDVLESESSSTIIETIVTQITVE